MSHSLHTGGVTGSIPVAPTTEAQQNGHFPDRALPFPPGFDPEQTTNPPAKLGENRGTLFGIRSGRKLAHAAVAACFHAGAVAWCTLFHRRFRRSHIVGLFDC